MRRFLPTGLQVMTSLCGGIGLMGAIAGLLSTYRGFKYNLFNQFGGGDLSADWYGRHRRSEQCSSSSVLQLG
ncbi:hypothetical protein [Pseudanabaena sp. FACHB-2040]|uniref:hypothetical protein n=1 Tax=Pseudanabaena sp. FACHB-2040 TaxID=2692859 RepID=UPI001682B566|nr:hypothetical protein [Pseudanabaena sp. FACHB-2040]MBD0270264.1 hypothetical protein [Cyanobacteria bacterium Co-bin8]MBD2257944.1 hypothetical protein [Pseudanabaena sp. FACHB-2040]